MKRTVAQDPKLLGSQSNEAKSPMIESPMFHNSDNGGKIQKKKEKYGIKLERVTNTSERHENNGSTDLIGDMWGVPLGAQPKAWDRGALGVERIMNKGERCQPVMRRDAVHCRKS
jgi:hypothetical protein